MNTETAATKAEIQDLVKTLIKYSDAYYNDKPLVSDDKFDKLEKRLKQLDPTNLYFKRIGAPVKGNRKVKLPYPIHSLDKVRPEDGAAVNNWLKSNPGPKIISDKLDGSALEIVYPDSGKVKVFTRGDGRVGQDVSWIAPHLRIPDSCPYKALRAEAVMTEAQFKSLWAKEFKNSRNLVNGLVNRREVHDAHANVDVIIHEVLEPRGQPSKQLSKLKSVGFHVVWHEVFDEDEVDSKLLSKILKQRKGKGKVKIDGLVMEVDKAKRLNTDGNPEYKIAYKENLEEDQVDAVVVNVEWNASKHGYLKPRIEVKPVEIDEVTVTYCTAFNGKYIFDNKIGPGAVVRLARSGGVIPDIQRVVKPAAKAQMPKGVEWHWSENKQGETVDCVLDDPSQSDDVLVNRLLNFFTTIGARDIGESAVRKLMEAGHDTPSKIIALHEKGWQKLPGYQGVMGKKLHDQLEAALTDMYLATLADATGLFGRGFGTKRFSLVLKAYPKYDKLLELPVKEQIKRISSIRGFQETTAQQFVQGLPLFVKWLDRNDMYITFAKPKKKVHIEGPLTGMVVCFTKFRDQDLADRIRNAGGEASDSFTSSTDVLLVPSLTESSKKIDRAKAKKIPIFTPDQFVRKYKI